MPSELSKLMSKGRASGKLCLVFAVGTDGQTRLTGHSQEPPLQVIRAFDLADGSSLVHLHNLSGGVLGGDRLETRIEVGPMAQVQVTTTGATRVYRPRRADPAALQITHVAVAAGGLLEYLPDPLIPFAEADYRQETQVSLAPDAGLFWWETVAPGRAAHGELFAYERLALTFDLLAGNRLIARERTKLEPHLRPVTAPGRLGPYGHFCTFYICRVGETPQRWLALEAELCTLAQELSRPGELLWGTSTLPQHGLSVRGLSRTGRDLPSGLLVFWQAAKRFLYGREPIPPRKVY